MPRAALRISHQGITLNDRSLKMEARLGAAISLLLERIRDTYGYAVEVDDYLYLDDILDHLRSTYTEDPKTGFVFTKATEIRTYLKPDGGFVYVWDRDAIKRCILVTEVKRQGTNADRLKAGLKQQARGNAIERLRKNMQGFDALFAGERITPFVCFGEGDDFAPSSSILDRIATMNSFFPLNTIYVDKIYRTAPELEVFKPASLFFKEEPHSAEEMLDIMWTVCQRSIAYYEQRYGPLRRGAAELSMLPHDEPRSVGAEVMSVVKDMGQGDEE